MTTVLLPPQPVQAPAQPVGLIHSVETCGAVDGPGLRYVIFTQGCPLRCRYCHNPDTWNRRGGTAQTVADLLADLQSYLPFMRATGGGVTVSGGEPLLQASFVAALFQECRRLGIHTALDTSGYATEAAARAVLPYTDLVLLDIKHMDPVKHRALTGVAQERTQAFARLVSGLGIPIWIRYVVVPGLTDDPADVRAMAEFARALGSVQRVELLPYHLLGRPKYDVLGIPYPLDGVEPPSEATMDRLRTIVAATGLQVR
jgi:pyruvate formate lyase activating enzyme